MKHVLTLLLSFISLLVLAQELKKVKGNLETVTLYSMGAMITESGKISLNKGINKIAFINLPRTLDPKVLLLQFLGNTKVISITTGKTDKSIWVQDKEYKSLLDSIESVNRQKAEANYNTAAYTGEKTMLDANHSIGGSNTGVNTIELQKAMDFYRVRMANIHKLLLASQQTEAELSKLISKLTEKKASMENSFAQHNNIIYATLQSEKVEENFELRYFVNDCGWAASYDLKILDISKPVSLIYQSKLYNNTGTDWNDINLTISTADPSKTAQYPMMSKWVLEEIYPAIYYGYVGKKERDKGDLPGVAGKYKDSEKEKESTMTASELSIDFNIKDKKSIPSDSKPYLVEMSTISLTPSYRYMAIPKLDAMAYLICGIVDWEQYNLIEGPANVYYDKTYIGASYIAPHLASDTLEISIGRDQKVNLKYEKKKDYSKKSLIGGTITQTFTYEISIRNNNSKDISLDLFDQVPISPNNDISVEVNDVSKADYTKDDGKLQWKVNLKAGESAKYLVSYSIKYPKGRPVQTVQYRKLMCPSF